MSSDDSCGHDLTVCFHREMGGDTLGNADATAYTAPMAELLDEHCDLMLVGDSVGMVVHGLPNTVGGTLEMMILRTLKRQPLHGYALAQHIKRTSDDLLQIEEGSLYPALQRLQQEGWITAEWGVSKNNQRAKYYRLTPAGRRKLVAETSRWERFVRAVTGVLRPAE